jgi:hypothetical protein
MLYDFCRGSAMGDSEGRDGCRIAEDDPVFARWSNSRSCDRGLARPVPKGGDRLH